LFFLFIVDSVSPCIVWEVVKGLRTIRSYELNLKELKLAKEGN
jgi:hypothetical protein